MKTKIAIIFLCMTLVVNYSCRKNFEEINTPNDLFTDASDGSLFSGLLASCIREGNELFYVNNEVLYKQSQLGALTKEAWGNYPIGTENIWSKYYTALPNVRELEKRWADQPDSPELNNMKAMLKIINAYKTFKVTDLFGDIPYTEAGYGYQDASKLYPKFDKQRDIYLSLLDDLKSADENINTTATDNEPFVTFKEFDKLFDGDMILWRKFANSLRLRYAMRMADKEPALAGDIVSEIINGNKDVLVGANMGGIYMETAALYFTKLSGVSTSIYWSFREHKALRMGSNMWHQMSENDSTDGSGIFDARAYLFFDTNNDNEWAAYPQNPPSGFPPDGGVPYKEQRESDAGYSIKGEDCKYSPFNIFMINSNYIPEIFMTGQEVNFLKAEAYQRGIGVAQSDGDADNEYLAGLQASYSFWRTLLSSSKLLRGTLPFNSLVTIPTSINMSLLQLKTDLWNFPTQTEKLKMIYTQRWIDLFWQPNEAFALARTNRTPREGAPISFYRFPIPNTEVNYNAENWSNAYGGNDLTTTKLWWIP